MFHLLGFIEIQTNHIIGKSCKHNAFAWLNLNKFGRLIDAQSLLTTTDNDNDN
jgi:hypothetical protein